jgi:hypothetical protein
MPKPSAVAPRTKTKRSPAVSAFQPLADTLRELNTTATGRSAAQAAARLRRLGSTNSKQNSGGHPLVIPFQSVPLPDGADPGGTLCIISTGPTLQYGPHS